MILLWSPRNEQHLEKHGVNPEEAESVIRRAKPPDPENVGDGKRAVWGQTSSGRYLQVIYIYVETEEVEPDEYERLALHHRIALEAGEEAVRVIHARDLTKAEKRQFSRRRRGLS
jgi:uncharacterized DUF497 family protein